jgi:ABC-type nitrate/sulfonate/bicarbonate transport system ATPase subunit
MITFRGVSKSYGGRPVLQDISFEIKSHEVVSILGSSGSGKTTLLRLIARVLKQDAGEIETGSSRIGFVFQDHRLLPWRSALDNVALMLRAAGKSRDESRERAAVWLDRMGLKGFYSYYPGQLSGGMARRVSIARAFAVEPEIMLMDEPFSSLDVELADAMLLDLKGVLRESKATVVFVTHDFMEAINIADRLFRLGPEGLIETPVTDKATMCKEYMASRMKGICNFEPGSG